MDKPNLSNGTNNESYVLNYHGRFFPIICRPYQGSSILEGTSPPDFSFTLLLLEMSLVLVFSQLMRLILKPLKQPRVITDVLAGIIVGPSVLGRHKAYAKIVIPDTSRFMIKNLGIIGFMFYLFVTGVKMDISVLTKSERKHWIIAIAGVAIPHAVLWGFALYIRQYLELELRNLAVIGGIVATLSITTFPVIYSVLRDMHLISTEIGRFALATAIITDVCGVVSIVGFEALKQCDIRIINALYYVISVIILSGFVVNGVPFLMQWINKQTPEGKPVEPIYITATLLGVFIVGFFTDCIGAAIGNGPLWLGLAIPDGPQVGETLVQKSEVVMNEILMPFAYASVGMQTDIFAMSACWSCLTPLFALVVFGYLTKFLSVVMTARFVDMPYKDSIILGFILSIRGQTEFLLYLHWIDLKIIKTPNFSSLVILTIIVTAISTPVIHILYDPTKPYMINKKRTIQHTVQDTELPILACIYDEESVSSLFSLLDFANPNETNPFTVFALHLIQLTGRAAPVFIDHTKQAEEYWNTSDEEVHNCIKLYEEVRTDCITMNFFTSVTPRRTMYQDICEVALLNNIKFIVLPFHKKCIEEGYDFATAVTRPGVQSTNANTLSHAPCSVGILACKDAFAWGTHPTRTLHPMHRQFALLFLGGPDAREALMLADRMVGHPYVSLIVVRFLAKDYKGDVECERKLDDGVVTWFWMKNERNEKVVYKEVVVTNGAETVLAIQSLNESVPIDLWIVGRKNGINPTLLEGLSEWSDNPELGLIGDYMVSIDFNTSGSVLVIQQQVLRDQRATPWACY